jgi:hypothetical protein
MGQNILLLTLIALPLVGFILTGFLGKYISKRITVTIATLAVFSSFICALLLFNMNVKTQIVHLFNVVNFEDFKFLKVLRVVISCLFDISCSAPNNKNVLFLLKNISIYILEQVQIIKEKNMT